MENKWASRNSHQSVSLCEPDGFPLGLPTTTNTSARAN